VVERFASIADRSIIGFARQGEGSAYSPAILNCLGPEFFATRCERLDAKSDLGNRFQEGGSVAGRPLELPVGKCPCGRSFFFRTFAVETSKLLISFHLETAFFRCSSVNLQAYLCGVTMYASAQTLDFFCHNGKLLVSNLKTRLLPSRVSG